SVTVSSGAHLAPGLSPGVLTTNGDLTLIAGSAYDVDIGGTTPGNTAANHDQDVVTGNVVLDSSGAGVTLNLTSFNGFVPAPGTAFILIKNNGSQAVSGTFALLAEGAIVSTNFLGSGKAARITYKGGDGNDVAIVVDGPLSFSSSGGAL